MFIAPFCLLKYRWLVSALVLPIVLLCIEGAFFIFLRAEGLSSQLFGWRHQQWIGIVVVLGSIQFCVCRALKYTFFDGTKELAFAALPYQEQLSGKLMIDGICARLGRGSGCLANIGLAASAGGVLASSLFAGLIAIAFVLSWIFATTKVSANIELKPQVSGKFF